MLKLLLHTLGWLVAHTPEPLLRGLSIGLSEVVFWTSLRRRRLLLSNLDHAFPTRSPAWRRRIARESSRRLIETALLSLAMPCLDERRLRRILALAPDTLAFFVAHRATPFPAVIAAPHMAYWEVQTAMPLQVPGTFPEFGVIFRPLDNAGLNSWIQRARERFGLKLLSRKQGFQEALKILRRNGIAALLFDQNAGMQGALTLLFERVCSTSELPGLMTEKFNAQIHCLYPRRLGFWRIELHLERIHCAPTASGVTLGLNHWLEENLARDENLCASWLWVHDRWRNQDVPARRYRLEAKRNLLPEDLQARGLAAMPRKTRVFVRLPNWLGDVVMALPLLRALRQSRPDAEITLLAKAPFLPLLKNWQVADHLLPLPAQGAGYFYFFWQLRRRYPDNFLLFTNSFRGDLEAWLTGCRQRFGIVRPGRRRPLLSHAYRRPTNFDERQHHQLELWTNFLNHFGLTVPPDSTPFATRAPAPSPVLGFIAGSENNPEKRWPVEHWRTLIAQLPTTLPIVLFGTANDLPITTAIAAGHAAHVENLAGKTTLPDYCSRLAACTLLITNDTGGMHLANALGVPLLALFGPTNPVRTQPVFNSPVHILQPARCPATGGGRLADLTPEEVFRKVRQLVPEVAGVD